MIIYISVQRIIHAVGRCFKAHGVIRAAFVDDMCVADPFAAVVVAADDNGDKVVAVSKRFCRKGVGTAVVGGLGDLVLVRFDASVVAADGV